MINLIQIIGGWIRVMKNRNPSYGYLRIAMQLNEAFGINLDEGIIRRVLGKHYKYIVAGAK